MLGRDPQQDPISTCAAETLPEGTSQKNLLKIYQTLPKVTSQSNFQQKNTKKTSPQILPTLTNFPDFNCQVWFIFVVVRLVLQVLPS